jgi:hypothetical protein
MRLLVMLLLAAAPLAQGQTLPERKGLGEAAENPFASRTWQGPKKAKKPKAQPQAEPAPAPPPMAPPLTWRFAGTVVSGGALQVLLAQGDRVLPVAVGETLSDGWRVDSLQPGEVVLTYVALGEQRRIGFSSTLAPGKPPEVAAAKVLAPARLEWRGPQEVPFGTEFSVTLIISAQQPVGTLPLQVGYDADQLEVVSVRSGEGFGKATYKVGAEGSISIAASSLKPAPLADAQLVEITFRPIGSAGKADVWVDALNIKDVAGRSVEHAPIPAKSIALTP